MEISCEFFFLTVFGESVFVQDYSFNKRYTKENMMWFLITQVFGKPTHYKKTNFRLSLTKQLISYFKQIFKHCTTVKKLGSKTLEVNIDFPKLLKVCGFSLFM